MKWLWIIALLLVISGCASQKELVKRYVIEEYADGTGYVFLIEKDSFWRYERWFYLEDKGYEMHFKVNEFKFNRTYFPHNKKEFVPSKYKDVVPSKSTYGIKVTMAGCSTATNENGDVK